MCKLSNVKPLDILGALLQQNVCFNQVDERLRRSLITKFRVALVEKRHEYISTWRLLVLVLEPLAEDCKLFNHLKLSQGSLSLLFD